MPVVTVGINNTLNRAG